jgi:hypothetical protein
VYSLHGTDEEKLSVLRQLSAHDHQTIKTVSLPERFTLTGPNGQTQKRMTTISTFYDPNSALFTELFTLLEKKLPVINDYHSEDLIQTPQKLPDGPLCATTLIIEDSMGNRRAIITDEDRQWLEQSGFGQGTQKEVQFSEVFEADTPIREEIRRYFAAHMDMAKAQAEQNTYAGDPDNCELCEAPFINDGFFVDGAIRGDSGWALMCTNCFGRHGQGIAWGKGQLYKNEGDNGWLQVGGFQN